MVTRSELMQREQALRGVKTLSVYLGNAWTDDPAQRDAWRIALKNAVEARRAELRHASHAEREAYDACVAHLWAHLASVPGVIGDPGWAAFITTDGVVQAEAVAVDLPTRVDWGEGMQLAPYVRVLKQGVPAVVAVVDSAEARLYRYAARRLARLDVVRAHKHVEAPQHMGSAAPPGFHQGTRGAAGADEADRARIAAREGMLRELADRLAAETASGGWILIGGIPSVVGAALGALPTSARMRAHGLETLDVHATEAEIARAAERGATEASRARDAAAIEEILSLARSRGKGLTGWTGTREALRQHAVDRLCFTERFLLAHPVEVELGVILALEQDADVAQVSGAGAERLDAEGEGIGVRLRFLPTRETPPVGAWSAEA